MMRTVACISLCLSITVSLVTAQSTTGTCTANEQQAYVGQQLPTSCGLNLGIVNSNATLDSSTLDAALDIVCTDECGGELSEWLLDQCNDTPGAEGLYYWCLNTGGTASNSRCRYATPPYFDTMSSLGGAAPCFEANATNPCPDGCSLVLMGLATIGCCYQSLYNNTAYLQGILNAGTLTQEQFGALQGLGNPLLWAACQVAPPAMQCTDEGIEFPTVSFAATIVVHPCSMISMLVMTLYMLF